MRLLPWAALRSDSEQLHKLFFLFRALQNCIKILYLVLGFLAAMAATAATATAVNSC
jgi:hypothetical protein